MTAILSRVVFGVGVALFPIAQSAVAMSLPVAQQWTPPGASGDPQVLVQYRPRGNFNASGFRGNVTANRNVNINSNRNVTVNRNVNVTNYGGNYGPNWGGVAAGVVVGAGIGIAATAAASAAAYPPPPPYPYYYPPPY